MADYIDSWYARGLGDDQRYAALTGAESADVCIIGGGLAGLTTALELVERGRSVIVLEAHRIGWGASGRNGGFVSAGYASGMGAVVDRVGLSHARELYQLSVDAREAVRSRIERFAIPCGPVTPGIMKASLVEDPTDAMAREQALLMERFGAERRLISAEELRPLLATKRYGAGLLDENAFHQHSLNFTRGIAAAVASAGGRIAEQSPAVRFERRGTQHVVHTAAGSVQADQVVLAASGYIGWLYPKLSAAIVPVATYVMTTPPLGDRLAQTIAVPWGISDTRFCNDYYRPLSDTRLMWGGRVSSSEPSPDRIGRMLQRDMLKVYPQLVDVPVDVAWGGTMGYARHKMPLIGTFGDGIWYATAFGGHGMAQTSIGGAVIGRAIAEGDDRYKLFAPWGLAFAGGNFAKPIAQLVYWGHKARDAWRARAAA
jgi:gamma-glutamylputrescine oxidase